MTFFGLDDLPAPVSEAILEHDHSPPDKHSIDRLQPTRFLIGLRRWIASRAQAAVRAVRCGGKRKPDARGPKTPRDAAFGGGRGFLSRVPATNEGRNAQARVDRLAAAELPLD